MFNDVPVARVGPRTQEGSGSNDLVLATPNAMQLDDADLLPGWKIVLRGNENRTYKSYVHNSGVTARSLPDMRDKDLAINGSMVNVPLLRLTDKSIGYVLVDESLEVPGPPFGQRCSNFSQGCLINSVFGRHSGLCSNVLLVGKRRR